MDTRLTADGLGVAPLSDARDLTARWNATDVLTLPTAGRSTYTAGFACSDSAVRAAQRLRYEVFNLELDEGFTQSALTGLDQDEYDPQMTHLVLLHNASCRVVGCYRLQTASLALERLGLYSAQEYVLAGLEPRFPWATECGRACLAADHRSLEAILQLWLGIGAFMNLFEQNYLFGCCSIKSEDPDDGWRALKTIRPKGYLHPELYLPAQPAYSCGTNREADPELGEAIPLPKLFRTYMRLGAKVVSEPALDRAFGTVDFLVLMDGREVNFSRLDVLG